MARSGGFVSLLVLLVLLSLASGLLLRALNADHAAGPRAAQITQDALARARDALVGYAARYPDTPGVALTGGPGRLPCPDLRLDAGEPLGAADSPCAQGTRTETGRFPWHTLGLPELRDGSGAPLFYAVANPFRAQLTGALNAETRGSLRVDDCTREQDIVAVIIAPGSALSGQSHGAAVFGLGNYLEGENASPGDGCFSHRSDTGHNDVILALTRAELMQVVSRRVAQDVTNALMRYAAAHGGLPWLDGGRDPAIVRFRGAPGVRRGWLPLRMRDAATVDPRAVATSTVAFPADFSLEWTIPTGGRITREGNTPPDLSCVRASDDPACTSGSASAGARTLSGTVMGRAAGEWSQGYCKAQRGGLLACEARRQWVDAEGVILRRTWTVVLGGWPHRISPPSAAATRLEHFVREGGVLATGDRAETLEIGIRDDRQETAGGWQWLGTTRLQLGAGDPVTRFALGDVPYDLEIDDDRIVDPTDPALDPVPDTVLDTRRSPGELPFWFTSNRWHPLVQAAFAAGRAPGAGNTACAGNDALCLRLTTPAGLQTMEAVVVLAGASLASLGQQRPGSEYADYFEGQNQGDDGRFESRPPASDFNDFLLQATPP